MPKAADISAYHTHARAERGGQSRQPHPSTPCLLALAAEFRGSIRISGVGGTDGGGKDAGDLAGSGAGHPRDPDAPDMTSSPQSFVGSVFTGCIRIWARFVHRA